MDKRQILRLMSVPRVGHLKARLLISRFGSVSNVFSASVKSLMRIDGIVEETAQRIRSGGDEQWVDNQLKKIREYQVRLVSLWDEDYPQVLKTIYDPPALLSIKGELPGPGAACFAIVGMREPSQIGRWAAETLSRDLASRGITIVSGMARGVDTSAHRGALKTGGKTVAVLGSGLDVIYPPENERLFNEIIQNGCVISEYAMGEEPLPHNFPRRNRIISGLCPGTLVVEAGVKSGALITAYMALEQGREVFAVPGSIRGHRSRGTHKLIKEGAKLVENVDDILAELPQLQEVERSFNPDIKPQSLTKDEMRLWEYLTEEPIHIDTLAPQAGMSTQEALSVLLSLELKDTVKQLSGMMFMRTN